MSPTPPSRSHQANPQRVTENCWMIGYRDPTSLLQCNTYLRIFPGAGHGTSICIDPGSLIDLSVVEANIQDLTGNQGLSYITVNHQDPDVTGNLPTLCHSNPAATVMLSEDSWRLIRHLKVRPNSLDFSPPLGSRRQTLVGGISWQPVPTPFCHFRGAMAYYDPESRTLFSGDLFGGLNQLGRVHLHAEETDWSGIAHFHQIYMPSREILRYAILQIRALTPSVQRIAPQHGYVIEGDLVPLFLERMEQLLVGSDLLTMDLDSQFADNYRELCDLIIEYATAALGSAEVADRLQAKDRNDGLEQCLAFRNGVWEIRQAPYSCSAKLCSRLMRDESPVLVRQLRDLTLRFCAALALPVPPIGWGTEVSEDHLY